MISMFLPALYCKHLGQQTLHCVTGDSPIGDENTQRQMGLCYEGLGKSKMATEAYREAWNALLNQRDQNLKQNMGTSAKEAKYHEIGRIIRQASIALQISTGVDLGIGQQMNHAFRADGKSTPPAVSPGTIPKPRGTPAKEARKRLSLFDR